MPSSIETVMMDTLIRIETKLAVIEANQKTVMNLLINQRGGGEKESTPKEVGQARNSLVVVPDTDEPTEDVIADKNKLRDMTPKQHAVLQLVVRGWRNNRISELMDVTVNTTKQHIRSIMDKFGVRSRSGIAVRVLKCMQHTSEDEYLLMSGGLPKDWARGVEGFETLKELEKQDPYFKIYAKSGTNTKS